MLGLVHYTASIRGFCVCGSLGWQRFAVSPFTFALLRGEDLESLGCSDFKLIPRTVICTRIHYVLQPCSQEVLPFGGLVSILNLGLIRTRKWSSRVIQPFSPISSL